MLHGLLPDILDVDLVLYISEVRFKMAFQKNSCHPTRGCL